MEMHQIGDHQAPDRGVSSGWIQCHFPSPREMQPLSDLQLLRLISRSVALMSLAPKCKDPTRGLLPKETVS